MSTLAVLPDELKRVVKLFCLDERAGKYTDCRWADLWSGSGVSPSISTQGEGSARVERFLPDSFSEAEEWCDYPYRIVWRSAQLRAHVTYCEGDVSVLVARSDEDYAEIERSAREFYEGDDAA